MQSGQWSLLLVDLIGAGAVVVALAYGISFGGTFAKWSNLTISDQTRSPFQLAVSLLNGPWRAELSEGLDDHGHQAKPLAFDDRVFGLVDLAGSPSSGDGRGSIR